MKYIASLLGLLLLAGCAATPTLKPQVANDLQQQKVAAAFYMLDKEIVYNELVYKVLWNESRTQKSNFTGFWDVDRDLGSVFAQELQKKQVNAVPIADLLSGEAYEQFNEAVIASFPAEGQENSLVLPELISQELKKAGVGYVMVLRGSHFYMMQTTALNSTALIILPTLMFVYDIPTQTKHFSEVVSVSAGAKYGDSPRNLEANDLAILKQVGKESIENFAKTQLPKVLGLPE